MKEIGEYLKNKRIELGITLDEAEQFLKIRKKYIVAIEEGDESVLPGKTYFVGYLRNYANYLQVDQNYIDQLLDQREQPTNILEPERQIKRKKRNRYFSQKEKRTVIKKEKKPINILPILKIALVILLIGGFVFIINQFVQKFRDPHTPIAENSTNIEEKTIEQEMLEIAKENFESEDDIEEEELVLLPPLPDYKPIEITANEPSWVRISQDDMVLFEGIVMNEEKIIVKSDAMVTLVTTSPNRTNVSYSGNVLEPQPLDDAFLVNYQIVPDNN